MIPALKKIFLLCFLFHTVGFSDEGDWKSIEIQDTLDVYLANNIVGDIIHSVTCDENAKRLAVKNIMSINDFPGAGGAMTVRETRLYDIHGLMISAYQEMEGQSGINSWGLKKISDGWELCVIVGGKKTSKKILDVNDNLASECFLRSQIKTGALKKNDTWNDTAFELMSAQPLITKIVCVNVDTIRHRWIIENTDNISGRPEKVIMDENGKTVEQSIEGIFVAKCRNCNPLKDSPAPSPIGVVSKSPPDKSFRNITELFSIAADKPCPPDKAPAIVFIDSTISLDTSVSSLYQRHGATWLLRTMPSHCTPKKSSTHDSEMRQWLKSNIAIQSDHPKTTELANKLRGDEKSPCEIIAKFNNYVFSHLQKRNTPAFSNALETLNAGYGDCGEHAALLTALLRAAGVPARVALGLLYVESKKQYYYHAQVMAFAGEWIFCDPTWNEFPSLDRVVPLIIDDTGSRAMLLSRLIGRIQIQYVKREQ
jgi:hypothetical protein